MLPDFLLGEPVMNHECSAARCVELCITSPVHPHLPTWPFSLAISNTSEDLAGCRVGRDLK